MKSWNVEAAIIAVGLLLLGIMVKGGINNFVNKDRVVSVKAVSYTHLDVYKRQTFAWGDWREILVTPTPLLLFRLG